MAEEFSPKDLAAAFNYATDWFSVYVEAVNALNVYPVPDGDTGTNMHLTLQSVRRELDALTDQTMALVAVAIARGSLLGARGNSGVILSQILRGFSEIIRDTESLNAITFAQALANGSQVAYTAVVQPVEGTILTVARAVAEGAAAAAQSQIALEKLLAAALAQGWEILAETPKMLPALAQAGVVDAGGEGYLRFLEGITGWLLHKPLPEAPKIERYAQQSVAHEEFGYCTEFLLANPTAPLLQIRDEIGVLGDSLMLVEAEGLLRGHIHTDEPDLLLGTVARYGEMRMTKVEDMSVQHSEILSGKALETAPELAGVVAVALGWGPSKAFRDLGVRVIAGGQTQNPSVQDILDAVKSLPNPEVLVLPDNKNVHMAAQRAAELAAEAGKRVFVLPTRTVGQGLAAAVLFSPETPIAEQLPGLEEAAFAAHTIEITHSTRNAFVEQVGDVTKGQALALLDDKIVAAGENPEAVLLEQLEAHLNGAEILTLFHNTESGPQSEELVAQIQANYPDLEIDLNPGGPELYPYIAIFE